MDGPVELDFIGSYKCNAQARQHLAAGLSAVEKPMVDWTLFDYFSGEYQLVPERDNKSVWRPEQQVEGLARFGDTLSAALVRKFCWFEQLNRTRSSAKASARAEETSPSSPRPDVHSPGQDRRVPRESRRAKCSTGVDSGRRSQPDSSEYLLGREHLSNILHRGRSRDGNGQWDPEIYAQARNATFRVASTRSRGNTVLPLRQVVDKVLHDDKSAGAPFFGRVRDYKEQGLALAERVRSGTRAFDPYVAYRRIQHGASAPKGRLVWGSPLPTTILASAFAKPAYASLRAKRCFAYGRGKYSQGAVVSELQARFKRVYTLDFSGFDASVPAQVIDDAFGILKTHLDLSGEEKRTLDRLIHDFIHARIVLSDCSMWQKHRGIPSGSPFTSLIGSIANLLILNYIWIRLTGRALDEHQVMVLGDDSIIATNSNPSMQAIAQAAGELGMVVSPDKSEVATLGQRVHFLGHYWKNGRPYRDPFDVARHIAFEERHAAQDPDRRALRLYGYLSESFTSYDMVVEYLRRGREHLPLEMLFLLLVNRAKQSDQSIASVGPGRLRYLKAHEPDLLPSEGSMFTNNAKLAGPGMAS